MRMDRWMDGLVTDKPVPFGYSSQRDSLTCLATTTIHEEYAWAWYWAAFTVQSRYQSGYSLTGSPMEGNLKSEHFPAIHCIQYGWRFVRAFLHERYQGVRQCIYRVGWNTRTPLHSCCVSIYERFVGSWLPRTALCNLAILWILWGKEYLDVERIHGK